MTWNADIVQASPIFAPLRIHGGPAFEKARPGLDDLQRLLDGRQPPVRVAGGERLRIVPQGSRPLAFEEKYEAKIHLKGDLQVRPDN